MAITPNSTVKILQNVPLDAAHNNTLYWYSTTAQTSYFSGQAKYSFDALSYQRRERSILLPISSDSVYDCNYLMYKNTNYGNRWFYAFVTAINYVNDNCAEVVYQFDPLQSWWGNWSRGMCYIEREHSKTDAVGDNLLPENFALGDYEMLNNTRLNATTNLKVYVACTFDSSFSGYYGHSIGNVFTGLNFQEFDFETEISDLITFIQEATEKNLADGIVSIFMAPKMESSTSVGPNVQTFNLTSSITGDFDGYSPKNNKIYTYPYNFIYVYTDDGVSIDYAYEYFENGLPTFKVYSSYSTCPELVLIPQNYKGAQQNMNEKLSLGGFPQCAYNIDSYKAWAAQNANGFWLQNSQTIANSLYSAIGSIVANNALSLSKGISNAYFSIAQDLNTLDVVKHMPNASRGSSTGGATYSNDLKDFYFCNMRIRGEFAKMIDDFWTRYGYPKRRLAIPDIDARPQYTYTKTSGAYIYGDAPAADLQEIASYFDAGITFWKNPANVGDYTVSNTPTS